MLDKIGIGGDRLEMFALSAAAGPRFAAIATEMTERIKRLGPNPLRIRKKDIKLEETETRLMETETK